MSAAILALFVCQETLVSKAAAISSPSKPPMKQAM
jgi:hypothetical protein